jgi:ParB-like chromosome segregation protein Spo0J
MDRSSDPVIVSGGVKFHPDLAPLMVDITLVRPHPDNPSSGDEDAIEESILVSGMYRPIYVQQSTGYILAGNTTYAVCMRLQSDQIPVVWLDVDDMTALRILLGDNQLARLALVDQALLRPQMQALLATELRLLGTGYSEPTSQVPENDLVPDPIEPAHLVCVNLTGDEMVSWFDLEGDTDRERLTFLIENFSERGA